MPAESLLLSPPGSAAVSTEPEVQDATPRVKPDARAHRSASRIQKAFKRYKLDREKVRRNREERGFIGEDKTSWSFTVKVVGLVLTWYTLSTALTVFNKVIYGAEHGKFPAPLLVTGSGMLLQFFLCRVFFIGYHLFVHKRTFGDAFRSSNPNMNTDEDAETSWLIWGNDTHR